MVVNGQDLRRTEVVRYEVDEISCPAPCWRAYTYRDCAEADTVAILSCPFYFQYASHTIIVGLNDERELSFTE